MNGETCWQSLITRYGAPLEPKGFDADTLKLAVTQRRALRVLPLRDGFGSGNVYFRRELTDEEVAALDHNWWERWGDVLEFTAEILRKDGR
jgi:hypothetical protein